MINMINIRVRRKTTAINIEHWQLSRANLSSGIELFLNGVDVAVDRLGRVVTPRLFQQLDGNRRVEHGDERQRHSEEHDEPEDDAEIPVRVTVKLPPHRN